MSISALQHVVESLKAPDAFRPRLSADQWRFFEAFLVRREVSSGQLLIEQGQQERSMHLLEAGSLQVFVSKPKPGQRLSILLPGALVGEAGLFTEQPRMANVEAAGPSVVWSLSGQRYEEMAARSPSLTLEVLRAAAAVMGVRMRLNMEMRQAVS
jgi:CRP/FNR family transcriptional regulator, cyclic AMP receptor protein